MVGAIGWCFCCWARWRLRRHWLNTSGRRPYGYRALGEVAVFLSFGLLGVCGNVYLQTHTLPAAVLLPAAGSGLLAANVLHINNIRDLSSDWAAGKHTLANKIGFSGSLKMHRALLLALPMMVRHARRVQRSRSRRRIGRGGDVAFCGECVVCDWRVAHVKKQRQPENGFTNFAKQNVITHFQAALVD